MASKREDEIFRARQSREGEKGGRRTLERYGKDFYSKIAKKRWDALKKKNGK